jgi:hypothetical protein
MTVLARPSRNLPDPTDKYIRIKTEDPYSLVFNRTQTEGLREQDAE